MDRGALMHLRCLQGLDQTILMFLRCLKFFVDLDVWLDRKTLIFLGMLKGLTVWATNLIFLKCVKVVVDLEACRIYTPGTWSLDAPRTMFYLDD